MAVCLYLNAVVGSCGTATVLTLNSLFSSGPVPSLVH